MKPEDYRRAIESSSYQDFVRCFNSGCSRCSLAQQELSYSPVLYRGCVSSRILLLGEAPGLVEQKKGTPFVGPAGELLEKIMKAIDLSIDKDMVLSNIVYCRPAAPEGSGKQNYTPKVEQIDKCWNSFGKKALELLDPKVIIACGRTSMQTLFEDRSMSIKRFEGKWLSLNDKDVFIMTHPASLLHQKNKIPKKEYQARKRQVWEYMKYFRDTLPSKLL